MQQDNLNGGKQDSSFEEMCYNTWKELYRFIYYRVQNREEAEDITQETYARVLGYIRKKEVHVQEYGCYLKAISLNIIRDRWRTDRKRGRSIHLEDVDPEEMSVEDFSEHLADQKLIEKALESLTKEQLGVITLRILKGYSVAETARIMHKKAGTIRVIQYRALKTLAKNFKS